MQFAYLGLPDVTPACMSPAKSACGVPQADAMVPYFAAASRGRRPWRICCVAQTDGMGAGSVKAAMQAADTPWRISFQMNERSALLMPEPCWET